MLKQNILLGQQNDELERPKQTEGNMKTEIAKLQSKLFESKIDCMEILKREGVAVSLRNDQIQVVANRRQPSINPHQHRVAEHTQYRPFFNT